MSTVYEIDITDKVKNGTNYEYKLLEQVMETSGVEWAELHVIEGIGEVNFWLHLKLKRDSIHTARALVDSAHDLLKAMGKLKKAEREVEDTLSEINRLESRLG